LHHKSTTKKPRQAASFRKNPAKNSHLLARKKSDFVREEG